MQGIRGHITSFNPIRPENRPDSWEGQALASFVRGAEEVSTVEQIDGQSFLRFMRPLITEKSCLKCHAEQGYAEDDIRGEISASVPLAPFYGHADDSRKTMVFWHLLVWSVGLAGIIFAFFQLQQQISAAARQRKRGCMNRKKSKASLKWPGPSATD